jgi:hypothetical protein
VADELTKLAKLRADGVLSDEEFDAEKAKLLGTSSPPARSDSDGESLPPAGTATDVAATSPTGAIEGTPALRRHTGRTLGITLGVLAVAGLATFLIVSATSGHNPSAENTGTQSKDTALTAADTYYTEDNQSYSGIESSTAVTNINRLDSGLTYLPEGSGSTGPSDISLAYGGDGGWLVLAAYTPASKDCWVLANLTSTSDVRFAGVPPGSPEGTYYAVLMKASPRTCVASSGLQPSSQPNSNGFPTGDSIRGTSNSNIVPDTSLISFEHQVAAFVRNKIGDTPGSDWVPAYGYVSVECALPTAWIPGKTFICDAYSAETAAQLQSPIEFGTVTVTVLSTQPDHAWNANLVWSPS